MDVLIIVLVAFCTGMGYGMICQKILDDAKKANQPNARLVKRD